jgi:ABC-type nitrate/sulfonate/bicarbonate transport system substrate-binding protein
LVGLLVRKDSPIKTIYDIKGKRITGEYLPSWLSGITCSGLLLVRGSHGRT